MKFLLIQLFLFVSSVLFMLYMLSLDYFSPFTSSGGFNWYNISLVLFLLYTSVQSVVSLIIFLSQKFFAFGWKEFPDFRTSLKWGNIIALSLIIGLLLNIFSLLVFPWGVFAAFLVIFLISII